MAYKSPPGNLVSRRAFLRLAGQAAALAVLAGCGALPAPTAGPSLPDPAPTGSDTPVPPAAPAPSPSATVPATDIPITASVGLDVMIGQMLMVGFRGLAVDDSSPIVRDIRERRLGGVVLFDFDVPTWTPVRNVASPAQVQALVHDLQAAASIPLLVSADQEGGVVTRLKERHGFPPTVSHQFLGETDDLAVTRQAATTIALMLAEAGINLNLAPVVDVNVNPDNPVIARYERSFSADPATVTRHARAYIEAHHAQGVLCCPKHFPGHGSSTADSHQGLVDVTKTWTRAELRPYTALIREGLTDAIMTAHVFNAGLDPDFPATLSRATIDGLLRGELGYDGVVISDDMQMGAIRQHYGFEEAVLAAIDAGVDVIAIANNSIFEENAAAQTVEVIKRAVETGRLAPQRIEQSYRRIRRLKERLPG